MLYIFYRTTNLLNGWKYYGIHTTEDLNDRYLGSGVHFKSAIKKYGRKNFKKEILMYCDNINDLKKIEKLFVTQNKINSRLELKIYNLSPGGGQGPCFKGKNHPLYGVKRPDVSLRRKGSKNTKEQNLLVSETNKRKGIKPPSRKGIKLTEEQKIKAIKNLKPRPKGSIPWNKGIFGLKRNRSFKEND